MKKIWLIIILAGIVLITVTLITFRLKEDNVLNEFYSVHGDLDDYNFISEDFEDLEFTEESLFALYSEEWITLPKARLLDSLSSELDQEVALLKDQMLESFGPTDYEEMDKSNFVDSLFFDGKANSAKGNRFIFKIDQYRAGITKNFKADFPDIVAQVEEEFSTGPVSDREGVQHDWLRFNYHGFPLVASISKMTQLQAGIGSYKKELFKAILEEED